MKPLSQKIKTIRQRAQLSQADFAKSVGVKQPTVAMWEKRGHVPEMPTILKICKVYKINIGELLNVNGLPDKNALLEENKQLREQVRLLNELVAELRKNQSKRAA